MNTSDADSLSPSHPLASGRSAQSRLVRAYQGERQSITPVWFMRQAGRSLPEYRELRVGSSMLDACLNPELASEITLQPVRRHGVDAAIFFSDIVIPLKLAGVDVDIVPGKGPVLGRPIRTAADVAALPSLEPAALGAVEDGVRRTVDALAGMGAGDTPLIGFAGAPFTLAAYLVEGGPSKDHIRARTLMHADPDAWTALMNWTADVTGAFLRAQVLAGASAAQLFDSWAGALSLADYSEFVAPASSRALAAVRGVVYSVHEENELTDAAGAAAATDTGGAEDAGGAADESIAQRNVPIVHFGVGTGELLGAMHDVGSDVIGVDYRVPLDEASRRLGHVVPLQGNIDPALLAAPWQALEAHVRDVLARGASAPSHVLNLGHGVPPDTDPAVLTRLVEFVHGLADDAGDSADTAGASTGTDMIGGAPA